MIVHHDESSYNATGRYDGGSKTEDRNVATSVRKQRIVLVLDVSRNVTRYVVRNVRFLKDDDDSCTLSVDCGMVSSSSPQLGDQDMKAGYENMKAPTTEDKKAPKDKWARPPLPAKGEETPEPTGPSGPAQEEEQKCLVARAPVRSPKNLLEEETTMGLEDEDEMDDDSASTVDVQDVPVETVRG